MPQSYEISKEAEQDWRKIIRYTLNKFGERQVRKYTKILSKCLEDLAKEKGHYKEMKISGHSVSIKHCQKHYIFALKHLNQPLLIIAIFHERMDLMQRLKHRFK